MVRSVFQRESVSGRGHVGIFAVELRQKLSPFELVLDNRCQVVALHICNLQIISLSGDLP